MRNLRSVYLLLSIFILLSGCITAQSASNQNATVELFPSAEINSKNETAILLHGLNRNARSMRPLAKALAIAGYEVCAIDYPSRFFNIKTLSHQYVLPRIDECLHEKTNAVNFVTHSLGGIIVRQLDEHLKNHPQGRLVMLSPPNQGSEAVDVLSNTWGFQQMAGPAGNELGTTPESIPMNLPVPSMPFAVIAARYSNSPMSFLIPGDDDGKVSLERMQLEQMSDFVIVNSTHSFMMQNTRAIEYVLHFLEFGNFGTSELN